ncbi:MAG: cofactor-independent phosphoglycerate mutase [Oscillospiraceae bacterium]|nr:cofactor-independent phosphoglycerate mutase [Oscillospiraceae bacterium]
MKYAVLLYDGMADLPCPALDGATPMEKAHKPHLDALAQRGEVGLVQTVAPGLTPGSDVANMSVLGFDPALYYTGRSPLEAVSIGVEMGDTDVALRCNLVTLSEDEPFEQKRMLDYSGGDISTAEAHALIAAVQAELGTQTLQLYPGVAYRHCLIVHEGTTDLGDLVPPHDISGQVIGPYLSAHPNAAPLLAFTRASQDLLKNHPVNRARVAKGLLPANACWFWGEGKKPALPQFFDLYGKRGSIISAVDLLKGIGILAGMPTPEVPGATGYIDTNFVGKADAAIAEWTRGQDLVYLHFEAPDECGHRGEAQNKVRAIELLDELVLPRVQAYLETQGDYKILVLPDHPTPLTTGKHAGDPVPYVLYQKSAERTSGVSTVTEQTAAATGIFRPVGHALMGEFVRD